MLYLVGTPKSHYDHLMYMRFFVMMWNWFIQVTWAWVYTNLMVPCFFLILNFFFKKVVGDDLWVLSNRMIRHIYTTLDPNDINFRIFRYSIKDNSCTSKRSLSHRRQFRNWSTVDDTRNIQINCFHNFMKNEVLSVNA